MLLARRFVLFLTIFALTLVVGLEGAPASMPAASADTEVSPTPSPTPGASPGRGPDQAKGPAADRGTSADYRFAGVTSINAAAAIEVTPGIPQRSVPTGTVILDRTFTINQASDALAIARATSGLGAVRVDDVLTVYVTHQDGSTQTRTRDFSNGCEGWVTPAGPLHLSGILEPGNNTVRFVLRDGCGAYASADPMYVVPVNTRVSDLAVLGSDCDLCAINPTVARGNPVNTATGNETKTVVDLQLGGSGTTFRLLRSYNSGSTHEGALGRGWNHPYESRLSIADLARSAPGDRVTYVGVDGQQAGFTQAADGSYTGDAGVQARLSKLADGRFELVQPDHSVVRFTATGLLQSMVDQSGVGLTMTHTDGKLSSVTDAAGRAVDFSYEASGRLAQVELPDGRNVQYAYTGALLTGVRDTRGGNTAYDYNTGGRLTKVTDPLGRTVINEYDASGKVIKQTDPRGQVTQYAYDALLGTTVTRPNGGRWTDHYMGNVLVGTSDAIGNHTAFGYDANLNLIATTDPRGNTTRMTYDARGNMLTKTAPAPLSYVEKWTYDANDNVLTYTDGRGKVTTFSYDSANRVTKQVFPDQWSNGFTYTSAGQLATKLTARGHRWTYDYDPAGNLTAATSPLGNKVTMSYDGSGRLLATTDPRGNEAGQTPADFTTTQTYDAADHVASITQPDGTVASSGYDAVGNLISAETKAPDGTVLKSETFSYDPENRLLQARNHDRVVLTQTYTVGGHLASSTDATGAKTTYSINLVGWPVSMTRPRGNVSGADPALYRWTYRYDANGNRITEDPPTAGATQLEYDALNRVAATVTPLGFRTAYTYDGIGNVLTSKDHASQVTSYAYDSVGRKAAETLPGLLARRFQHDGDSNLIKETSPSGGSVTTWTYDADGRQSTRVDPRGNVTGGTPADFTTTIGYDPAGNVVTAKDQLGRTTTRAFDARNNLISQKDPRGGTTSYGYDGLQRLTSVTSPVGAVTAYSYDQYGELVERKNARNALTRYGYNARGDLTSIIDPLDRKKTFGYDPDGNLTETITGRGYASGNLPAWTIKQAYDARGLRTAVTTASAASSSTFGYDADGRLTSYKDATGTTTQSWNSLNQLTGVTHPQGNYAYTYTSFGAVRTRNYPGGGEATYDYDADGRIKAMHAFGQTAGFGYDVDDHLTSVTYPASSGLVETRGYDRAGDISSIGTVKSGGTSPVVRFDYTRDAARNPATVKRTRGTTIYDEAFAYDAANRLTRNCIATTTCDGADKYIAYDYDAVGNRLREERVGVANPGTITTTYDAADQIATRTNQAGQTGTLTYNADGQVTNGREWDVLGRLTKLGGTSFGYDALDLRRTITTTAGTKKWSWDVNNPLPLLNVEYRADGSYWRHRYLPDEGGTSLSGVPMYAEHPSVTGHPQPYGMSMMLHDALGTVTDITDTAGASRWQHGYEPFGTRTTTKLTPDAVDPAVGFTGATLEPTTGEYHLRARDYNLWGVFSNPDPITPDVTDAYVSAYTYTNQQPTLLTDPTGMWPDPGDILGTVQSAINNRDDIVREAFLTQLQTSKQFLVGVPGGIAQLADEYRGGSDYLTTTYYHQTSRYLGVTGSQLGVIAGQYGIKLAIPGGPTGRVGVICIKVITKGGANLIRRLLQRAATRRAAASMGRLIPVNSKDPSAALLAERIGGTPMVKFAKDPKGREFDAVSDRYVAQSKPANFTLNKKFRVQAQATFEMAKQTGRQPYFHFDGPPGPGVLQTIRRYATRYGVEPIVDTIPLR